MPELKLSLKAKGNTMNSAFKFYLKCLIYFLLSSFSAKVLAGTSANTPNYIDASKIKYVSYMMASPKGSGQSSFGHSYLLFRQDQYTSPYDQAIEFVAAVSAEQLNYIRGLGLFGYDRQVKLAKLEIVKKEITIGQNRDLIIYDLKLTHEQKKNIIAKVNQILSVGKMGKYSFLSSNCAEAVSTVLNDIGIETTGFASIVPTQLRDNLQAKGLVTQTIRFSSIENLRASTVLKYSASLNSIKIPKYHRKLTKMFEDSSLAQQIFNVLLAQQKYLESNNPGEIKAFVSSYWLTFAAVTKKQFKNMIAVPIGTVHLSSNGIHSLETYVVRSSTFNCSEATCDLTVVLSRNDERKDFLSFNFPIKALTVKNDEVYYNNILVGVRTGAKSILSKNTYISFGATPVVTKYDSNEGSLVDIGFIVENNLAQAYEKKDISWNKDVIAQTNTDSRYPMCYTILHLQQAFMERAIFEPGLKPVGPIENIKILKNLLNGSIAVIPGFKNAYDFTKSIRHEDFVREFYPIHQSQYNGLMNGMRQWLQLSQMEPETLTAMAALTHKLNISIPVIFRKNNDHGNTQSHSVLITDMRDEGSYYSLSGYDPNYAHTTDFGTLDKSTMMMSTKTYGAVDIYLDQMEINKSLLNRQLVNSHGVREILFKQARRLNVYTYSANELLHMQ